MLKMTLDNLELSRNYKTAPANEILIGDIKFSEEGCEDQYIRQISVIEFIDTIYLYARNMAFLGVPKHNFDVHFQSTAGYKLNFERATSPDQWVLKVIELQTIFEPKIFYFESSFVDLVPSFSDCVYTIASIINQSRIDIESFYGFDDLTLRYLFTYPHREGLMPIFKQEDSEVFGIAKAKK